jgi:hypothetical protein
MRLPLWTDALCTTSVLIFRMGPVMTDQRVHCYMGDHKLACTCAHLGMFRVHMCSDAWVTGRVYEGTYAPGPGELPCL